MADIHNDDHPNIIKTPDRAPISYYGLGYELFRGMKQHSENIAQYLVESDEKQTFEDLLDISIRVALNLKTQNLEDDDIVGLCVGNSKHSCVPFVAGLFLGHKVVALDSTVTTEEKAEMLLCVTPKILFVDEDLHQSIEQSLSIAKLNIKLVVIGKNANDLKSYAEFLKASQEDIDNFQPVKLESNESTAVIFFGSGTTGDIKGVCISHYTLLTTTTGSLVPVIIVHTQLNWISHTLLFLASLRLGSTRVVVRNFEVEKLWTLIDKCQINLVYASVFHLAEMAKSDIPENVNLSSLKFLMTGGVGLPPAITEKLKQKFPNALTVQTYGLTEMGGGALYFNWSKEEHRTWHRNKPSSSGTPIDGIWYKVVDVETEKIVGPGEQGELRLKSKSTMKGYYNMDTSEAYDSTGWLKTGDIAYYDEDQCFFLVDRLKNMIKFRFWTISPSIIENILIAHPAIDKASVIGIPQEGEFDFPMAIVNLRKNCEVTPEELVKYVDERVDHRYRLRAGCKIISEMPLTSSGKVPKYKLRKMVKAGKL